MIACAQGVEKSLELPLTAVDVEIDLRLSTADSLAFIFSFMAFRSCALFGVFSG
jgi:hypothetical protein